ncbi:hypothetical protein CALVIDRAFT_149952 [Calocera viscosa TUFC12733]|uniref:Uncharacterized protein n=1 Tax=Calocera viscosa (strain TUFC12733) TaxID=1330018 RepID=A0A167LI55_CALVF|nr:hypothetical protein CALVIDRAFT_149952 [Calocera viscosa TUFC12733]
MILLSVILPDLSKISCARLRRFGTYSEPGTRKQSTQFPRSARRPPDSGLSISLNSTHSIPTHNVGRPLRRDQLLCALCDRLERHIAPVRPARRLARFDAGDDRSAGGGGRERPSGRRCKRRSRPGEREQSRHERPQYPFPVQEIDHVPSVILVFPPILRLGHTTQNAQLHSPLRPLAGR